MQNILFLTLRTDFGGGPEHLWQLLKHIPSETNAYVACPKDYPYYERYCECVGHDNIFELPHRKFSIVKLWKLAKFCKERRINVLHSHGKGAGGYGRLLSFLTGVPCIHTFHGVHTREYSQWGKIAYTAIEAFLSRFSQTGIAVSKGELEQIASAGIMPPEKLVLIENGVKVPEGPVEGPAGPPYNIVSISRMDYQKNSEFIIDIMKKLYLRSKKSDFVFIIVGEGSGKKKVEVMGKEFGNSLNCVGSTPQPHTFFAGALCYLSTSRWEGMPLAVLEAMAHGLPTVVSNVVGNRDVVIDGQNGFLYNEGDAEMAANAILNLSQNPALRKRLGHQAREYVLKNHDVRDMAAKTFKVLQNTHT